MQEIFVSADVEADGIIPGVNSMISLGSVAFIIEDCRYKEISSFEANLLELDGAVQDEEVMKWWEKYPDAWNRCRLDAQHPAVVMRQYVDWIHALPGRSGLIAYPASYDFMFIHWYLYRFTGVLPFGAAALCIKSYAMGILKKKSWIDFQRSEIPEKYHSSLPHDHTPLNDAREQGQLFASLHVDNTYSLL